MPRVRESNLQRFSPNRPVMELPTIGFVRLPTVLNVYPVSRASWYNGMAAGKYPKPVKLGPRTNAWKVSDIRALLDEAK